MGVAWECAGPLCHQMNAEPPTPRTAGRLKRKGRIGGQSSGAGSRCWPRSVERHLFVECRTFAIRTRVCICISILTTKKKTSRPQLHSELFIAAFSYPSILRCQCSRVLSYGYVSTDVGIKRDGEFLFAEAIEYGKSKRQV